jgi:hypothetical protein
VVYLPPLARGEAATLASVLDGLARCGVPPLLVQTIAGEPLPSGLSITELPDPETPDYEAPESETVVTVLVDPLEALCAGPLPSPPTAHAVLLIPTFLGPCLGVQRWEPQLADFAARGWSRVHPVAIELEPLERRRLVRAFGTESAFDGLFHGGLPSEREIARAAAQVGLSSVLERPLPRGKERLRARRAAAGLLALCGELWLRVGRPPGIGQELLRSARWLDRLDYDLDGLAREQNLRVLPGLEGMALQIVEGWLQSGTTPLRDELLALYFSS